MMKKFIESSDEYSEVDNRYSSEETEKHQVLDGTQIGLKVDKPKKQYKSNFSNTKDENFDCPYGTCGIKFVSSN